MMSTNNAWTVRKARDGWRVYYQGDPWVSGPFETRERAEEYASGLPARYYGDSARILMENAGSNNGRSRGGPWRWSLPDGTTGVVRTSRLKDARKILRREMERQRLPNGITWALEDAGA